MKNLVTAARALLMDFASTILFMALYALTGRVEISVSAGILLALVQLGWKLTRRERPDALQWTSLLLVIVSGTATLVVHNAVFVMLKPSVINVLVGCAMLQRGWMARYVPPQAMEFVPDLVIAFGYVWAGLMFFSALLNIVLALHLDVMAWSTVTSVWGLTSMGVLCLAQVKIMKFIGRRRHQALAGMVPATAASI